jgi:hypothetical protein
VLAAVRSLPIALLCLACGTNATGIETCRSIEQTRCEAAEACGLVDDVTACQRFARDHCLHGLATDEPSPGQLNACVSTLEAAGRCAKRNGKKSSPVECNADWTTEAETVCEMVSAPELAPRCGFLVPPEPEPTPKANDSDAGSG